MEELGFRFFCDGDVVPELRGSAALELELEASPAFRFRGDMIWDNYLGPRRYCASVWNEEDWERALLYMAHNRLNFLEFYPPLEHVLHTVFPEAQGLDNGRVLKAEAKHALAQKVLARARAFGIECGDVPKRALRLEVPEAVELADSLLEKLLGFSVLGLDGKVNCPGTAHEIGFLAWTFVEHFTVVRVPGERLLVALALLRLATLLVFPVAGLRRLFLSP